MTLRDELATANSLVEKVCSENADLREDNRELKEELAHYRAALAAVKWLWDRASEQQNFQL